MDALILRNFPSFWDVYKKRSALVQTRFKEVPWTVSDEMIAVDFTHGISHVVLICWVVWLNLFG